MESKVPPPLPPKTSTLQSQAAPPPVPSKPRAVLPDAAQLIPKLTGEQCNTADTSPSVSPCNSTDSCSPFHDHVATQERVAAPPPVPPRKRSSTPAVEQFEPQISPFTEVLFPHWPVPEAHHADFTTHAVTAAADEPPSPLKAARSRTTSEAVSVGDRDPFADWCSDLSPGSDAAESVQPAQWEPEAVENTTAAEVAAVLAAVAAETDHQDIDDVIDLSFPSAEEITSIAATASCLSSPASHSASNSRQFDSGHGFSAAGSGHGVTSLARPKSVRFAAGAAAATVPSAASNDTDSAAARLSPVHHAVSEMLDAAIVRAAVAVTHNAAIKHTRAKSAAIEAAFLPVAGDSLLVVAAVTSIVNELVADILATSATAAQLKSAAAQAVPPPPAEAEASAQPAVAAAVVAVLPPSVAVVAAAAAAAAEIAPDVGESWAVYDVFTAPTTAVSDDTAWMPDAGVAADDSITNFFSTDAVTNATTSSLTESADTEQQQWSFVTDFEETAVTEPTAAAATAAFSSAPAVDFSAFGSNRSSTQFSFAPAADEHKDSIFITSTDVDCDSAAAVTWDLPVAAVSEAADVSSEMVSDVVSESSKAMNSTASEFVAAVTAAAVTAAAVSLGGNETTTAADATDAAAATEADTFSIIDATVSSIDIAAPVQSVDAEELITIINSDDSGVQHADATLPAITDAVTTAVCDEAAQTSIIEPEVQEVVEVLTDSNAVETAVLEAEAVEAAVTEAAVREEEVTSAAVETVVVEVTAEPEVEQQQLVEKPAVSAVETAAATAAASLATAVVVAPTAVEAGQCAPPAAVVTESDAPFDAEPSQPSTVEMVTNRMTTHRSSFAGSTAAPPAAPAAAAAVAAVVPVAAAAVVVPAVKSFQAAPWLAPPAPASPEAATADAATAARVAAAAAAATAAAIAVNEAAGVRSRPSTSSNRSAAAATTAASATAAVNSVKTKARAFVSTTRGLLQRPLSMAKAAAGIAPARKQQQQQQQSAGRTTGSNVASSGAGSGDADVSAAEGGYPESEYDDVQVDDEEDVDIGKFGFCGLRVSRSPSPSRSPSHRQQQR
jgi:trimeric autotransporter adhesin